MSCHSTIANKLLGSYPFIVKCVVSVRAWSSYIQCDACIVVNEAMEHFILFGLIVIKG